MKQIIFSVLAVAVPASMADAATVRTCSNGSATCKSTAANQPRKVKKINAPVSRRQGHNDPFYQQGVKN